MTVSDNTKQAEVVGNFFKNLGKTGLHASKKMPQIDLKIPGRALDFGANFGSAFTSRSPEAASSSLPEVIIFHHTGK